MIKFARHKNDSKYFILSWNFYHKFAFQYKMLKEFYRVFRRDKRSFKNIFTCCFWPRTGWQARSVDRSVDRTKGRSTVRSTDVHRAVHVWQHSGPVDRQVDRTREQCSLFFSVDRAVDRQLPTIKIRPLDGRPTSRPLVHFWQDLLPTASFVNGL